MQNTPKEWNLISKIKNQVGGIPTQLLPWVMTPLSLKIFLDIQSSVRT